MSEIIALAEARASLAARKAQIKADAPLPHLFTLDLMEGEDGEFATMFRGPLIEEYETNPDVRRAIAHHLETTARLLRDEAEAIDTRDGHTVATVRISASSAISMWMSYGVENQDHVEWLREMLDRAKGMVRTTTETIPVSAA